MWFGGDVTRIVGACACPSGMVFDQGELQCETVATTGTNSTVGEGVTDQTATPSIGAIIGIVCAGILVLVGAGVCCFFAAKKM